MIFLMPKLELVIADPAEVYLTSIINYLIKHHSDIFNISSFTEQYYLCNFLSDTKKRIDILLISPGLYSDSIPKDKIGTIIFLNDGRMPENLSTYPSINKYLRGDKLVKSVINIFSENNTDLNFVPSVSKSVKVIAFYSPIGGVGTTTISVGCSIQMARRGKKVFYLNLEDIQSTPLFFNCESEKNFSDMIYFLKQNRKNLSLTIEGIRCVDHNYGIHYFSPPSSVIDLNELMPEELEYLIAQLKNTNQYDYIFLDMSSRLDKKNLMIMRTCDEIMIVATQYQISLLKMKSFLKELDILHERDLKDAPKRYHLLLNRYSSQMSQEIENMDLKNINIIQKIPRINNLIIPGEKKFILNMDNEFGFAITEVISSFEK